MSEENGNGQQAEVAAQVAANPFVHVQVTPFSTAVGPVQLPDGRRGVQLSFFHATGCTTLVCLPEEARQLANLINSQAGGLIVPVNEQGRLGRPQQG